MYMHPNTPVLYIYIHLNTPVQYLYVHPNTLVLYIYIHRNTPVLCIYVHRNTPVLYIYIHRNIPVLYIYVHRNTPVLYIYITSEYTRAMYIYTSENTCARKKERKRERERERGSKTWTCNMCCKFINIDYTLPAFKGYEAVAKTITSCESACAKNTGRCGHNCLFARASLLSALPVRAARVDSHYLCRLGCEDTKSERTKKQESEREWEWERVRVRESEREWERVRGSGEERATAPSEFVDRTRLLTNSRERPARLAKPGGRLFKLTFEQEVTRPRGPFIF